MVVTAELWEARMEQLKQWLMFKSLEIRQWRDLNCRAGGECCWWRVWMRVSGYKLQFLQCPGERWWEWESWHSRWSPPLITHTPDTPSPPACSPPGCRWSRPWRGWWGWCRGGWRGWRTCTRSRAWCQCAPRVSSPGSGSRTPPHWSWRRSWGGCGSSWQSWSWWVRFQEEIFDQHVLLFHSGLCVMRQSINYQQLHVSDIYCSKPGSDVNLQTQLHTCLVKRVLS